MISVLYEDNHLLVVKKPINIPTQEDKSKDMDLLNMLKLYIKDKYKKCGNVYLGLVHRLDRPVGGVMVFAKTSKCAGRLSEQIRNKTFIKVYNAVVIGDIEEKGTLIDRLFKDEKNNIVKIDPNGKESILEFKKIKYQNNMSLLEINLKTGRSHQIRVQLSNHGYPLFGDQKYNKNSKVGEQLALFSKSISFYHPVTKNLMKFELDLPSDYPFNIFKEE